MKLLLLLSFAFFFAQVFSAPSFPIQQQNGVGHLLEMVENIEGFVEAAFGKNGGDICELCQEGVTKLDQQISAVAPKISAAILKYVCPVAQPFEKECESFVNRDLAEAIDQIHLALKNPKVICQQVGACTKQSAFGQIDGGEVAISKDTILALVKMAATKAREFVAEKYSNDPKSCQACIKAVGEADGYLLKYGPVLIDYAINEVCPQLTGYEEKCKTWVNRNLKAQLEQLHAQLKDPKKYCKAVGVCA